jgi:hypothetical protein
MVPEWAGWRSGLKMRPEALFDLKAIFQNSADFSE